jgi:hypothetical protein
MTLIILSVVVIALLIAVLAIFLFTIGALLKRTADNLGDCVQSVKTVVGHATVIGPAIERINATGGTVVGALPLLCEAAESIAVAKSAPYADPSDPSTVPSRGVGYLDA